MKRRKEEEPLSQDESSAESAPDRDSDYVPLDGSEGDGKHLEASSRTKNRGTKRHNLDDDAASEDGARSQITVRACGKGGKQTWNKRHYCLYCRKPNSKMSRHLLRRHRSEKEVAAIVSLPPKSKRRIQVLEKLRRKGDYYHNICVLQKGEGQIVTCRRPTSNASAKDFSPCSVCFGFFRKSDLLRHEKMCRETLEKQTQHKNDADVVSVQVKKDPLICQFGERLHAKHASDPSKDGYVRQKVTQLERFLFAAKYLDPQVKTLHDVLVPSKFALALKAVKEACCSSTLKQWQELLPSEVGLLLKAVCDIAIAQYARAGFETAACSARDFLTMLNAEWNSSASHRANFEKYNCNEKEMMRLAEDVVKLHKMLRSEGEVAKRQLLKGPNPRAYKSLSEILLSQITLFNGRRQAEFAAMPLQTYTNRTDEVPDKDFVQYLSPLEKNFIEEFTKFVIRGEEGEAVLVVLTKEMKESLDFLVDKRSVDNFILQSNEYVFARQNYDFHLQSSSCLRKHAAACEAQRPETLTWARMRDHVVTLSQILNLNDNEVDQLAKLIGHDITEHRKNSCLTENTLLLANMSKKLMAMEPASDVCYDDSQEEETDFGLEEEDLLLTETPTLSPSSDAVTIEKTADMDNDKRQPTPEEDALDHICNYKDKPFLEKRRIPEIKRRGLFTQKAIETFEFVVEYRGDIFMCKNGSPSSKQADLGNFIEFSWEGEQWRIDATNEDEALGKFVNYDKFSANCEVRPVIWKGEPHLCLFAVRKIFPDDEITYCFGDSTYKRCRQARKRHRRNRVRQSLRSGLRSQRSSNSLSNEDVESGSGSEGLDLDEDAVEGSSKGSRATNYCYVCGKASTKISRHLKTHMNDEPDIAKAFSLRKRSQDRKKSLTALRNLGNYKHNQEVLRTNSGTLRMRRHPGGLVNNKEIAHCPHCKVALMRCNLWRHIRRCAGEVPTLPRKVLAIPVFPPSVKEMLSIMKQDHVTSLVQTDFLLARLALNLCKKYEGSADKHGYVRQTLRDLGKLLLALQEKSILSFKNAIKPKNVYKVILTIKHMAGFKKDLRRFSKPRLALRLRHSLKRIAAIALADAKALEIEDIRIFNEMLALGWSKLLGAQRRSKSESSSPSTVLFTRDAQLFYKYLEAAFVAAVEGMKADGNTKAYVALCRVTVALMSIINTCASEVSEMALKAFHEREKTSQVLSKHFIHMNLPGGTGTTVTILLTSELVDAIVLLASRREACGVHESNPFLFAKPDLSPTSFFRGVNSIKAFANLCRAKSPELFVSKNFQKHIARVFQILNLENDELRHLAKLLGLDIRTDKDYYQLPEAAEELAKIAQLLLAMEKGSLEKFKGNSLKDIQIEDESEAGGSQGSRGNKTNSAPQPGNQKKKLTPKQDALKHICLGKDKAFLKETFVNPSKERGVITQEVIEPSTFVVEFRGRITSGGESNTGSHLDKFVYHYSWKGTDWCIDASNEDGSLGRLVNDEHVNPNCKMRKVVCKGQPHLCLFAMRKISPGEEITYSYGKSSYPWRSKDERGEQSCSAESCCDEDDAPPGKPDSDDDASCRLRQNGLESSNSWQQKRCADELNSRRSSENTREKVPKNRKRYVLCLYCKCMYQRHFVSRHIQNCPSKPSSVAFTSQTKKVLDLCSAAEVLDNSEFPPSLEELITTMKDDEITATVKAEPVLLQVVRHSMSEATNRLQVVGKLRLMGKFLLLLRKSSVHSLDEATRPQNFVKVAETVRQFVGFNPKTKSCNQGTWQKLWECVKKSIDVMLARALLEDTDEQKLQELETFAKLCREEFMYLSPAALKPIRTVQFVRDVQLLHRFLEETASSAVQSLRMCACAPVFSALLRVTIAQLAVLNDSLSNISNITLESFQQRAKTEERQPPVLPRPLMTVHVRSSTGKSLPVVVTPDLLSALELLVSQRKACGVREGNPLLFAIPNHKPHFIKAHCTLSVFIRRSKVMHKRNLRSPSLHTQVVRIVRILSLSAGGLEELGRQLGRSIPVDPGYYRDPQGALDVARVSELLKDGARERFEGKSLEEIVIAENVEQDRPQVNKTENDRDNSEDAPRKIVVPKKRGRKPKKKKEEEEEISAEALQQNKEAIVELHYENPDEHQEKPGKFTETPEDFAKIPESGDYDKSYKVPCDNEVTKMSFSDDDMDMNVDFDLGLETGDDDNDCANDGGAEPDDDDCANDGGAEPDDDDRANDGGVEPDDDDCANDGGAEPDDSDGGDRGANDERTDNSRITTVGNPGVGSRLAAALAGMKEARIILTRLDIANFITPVSKSAPPPPSSPVSSPVSSQPVHDNDSHNSEQPLTPTPPVAKNKDVKKCPPAQAALVTCSSCKKSMTSGQKAFQKKGSSDVFCSKTCLFNKFPSNRLTVKTCHHCHQPITQPQDLIMAAVDVKGTMKDFCSISCLSSFKSEAGLSHSAKSACSTIKKPCNFTCELEADGSSVSRICWKKSNVVMKKCYNCLQALKQPRNIIVIPVDHFGTKKELCSSACLNALKCKMPQLLCKMCSNRGNYAFRKTQDGLELMFCSDDCFVKYHKANSLPVVFCDACARVCPKKHLLLKMGGLSKTICDEDCLHEFKEIVEAPQQCGRCQMFHRMSDMLECENDEGCLDFFCSNRCMTVHRSMKFSEKQGPNLEDTGGVEVRLPKLNYIKEEPVDLELSPHAGLASTTDCIKTEERADKEEPDSQDGVTPSASSPEFTCTLQQTAPVTAVTRCSMCCNNCTSKHKITQKGVVYQFCSQHCFLSYCRFTDVPVCQSCHVHCEVSILLRLHDGTIRLCSSACLALLKQETKTLQPCSTCTRQCLLSDMVEDKRSDGALTLFCSSRCVIASKIQNVHTPGVRLRCDHCGKAALPACHLAMADASIRNFCSLSCAMAFKETQKNTGEWMASSQQTNCDFLLQPDELPCASCSCNLTASPLVVQAKGKMLFVCSPPCARVLKETNSVTAPCEYCKNEQIAKETKRIDGKELHFCSEGCSFLYGAKLRQMWGEHCSSCAYCLSVAKTLVTDFYRDKVEQFCSQECNTKYNKLVCHLARCDTCGHEGRLSQSLPIPGDVKHFCDFKCLLHFCHRKLSPSDASPPTADPAEPSPVISGVMSLAKALRGRHQGTSEQTQSLPSEAPPPPVSNLKVCTHAAVQTAPKQLKNKSALCTPLVHNKGVSCQTQRQDSGSQTDELPNTGVPVPVPVYVPVPMSMYSQYAPRPLLLPLPLPVPIFLPGRSDDPAPVERPLKWSEHPDPLDTSGFASRSEMEKGKDENAESEDGAPSGAAAAGGDEDEADPPTWDNRELPVSQLDSLLQMEPTEEIQSQNKEDQPSSVATRSSSRRDLDEGGRPGINAWKRWTMWRQSQTSLYLVSALAVALSEDILQCSPAELSQGLACFVAEVKGPDGGPYAADRLFHICLDIQKYLFDNSRKENIFFDPIYKKFYEVLVGILRGFSPSAGVPSCVEEASLWECKQLGAYSPLILLHTLFYFCSKHFGLTTVEQHRQLSFAHVVCCTRTNPDHTKTTCIRFYPPPRATRTEPDGIPAKKRKVDVREKVLEVAENKRNPLQCPVKFYEFYLSKCSESSRERTDTLYLQPVDSCCPNSPVWFSSAPLDEHTLETMLARICTVRELRGSEHPQVAKLSDVPPLTPSGCC